MWSRCLLAIVRYAPATLRLVDYMIWLVTCSAAARATGPETVTSRMTAGVLLWFQRETNCLSIGGDDTTGVTSSRNIAARLTQLAEWQAFNLLVAGSSPASGCFFAFFFSGEGGNSSIFFSHSPSQWGLGFFLDICPNVRIITSTSGISLLPP